ncbi:MAG: tyrosine-protein phosphatase [Clostridia bacterium]|nr:tyrosine-protein phosphatase [Clostridia bacterium]
MVKKKFLQRALSLLIGCSMSLPLFACGGSNNAEDDIFVRESKYLSLTEFDSPVSLVDYRVTDYLSADPSMTVTKFLPGTTARLDKGQPVALGYFLDNPEGWEVLSAEVEVSETEDFTSIVQTQIIPLDTTWVDVYNLKTGQQYYFRVNMSLDNGKIHTKTGSFKTAANTPRFINLDGASNVRDIGGWVTEDGKTIKQGLLYRGGEIDGGKNTGHPDFCLTEKGIEQLLSFGIATDFDLRSESNKVSEYSILGSSVHREFYDAHQYQSVFNASYKPFLRKMFADLANPDAYPVYLHCTHGVDRAGTMSLLIEALLGLSKDDLVRDYELSAFYYNYAHVNRNFQNGGNVLDLIAGLESYEGETLAEKCATFLLSVGVTQEEIDTIRTIFLG